MGPGNTTIYKNFVVRFKYSIANKLFYSDFDSYVPGFIRKILIKKENLCFIPTNLSYLPKNNYTVLNNIDHHNKVIKQFNKSSNEVIKAKTFPNMIDLLKTVYSKNSSFNFLDFGGEEIDQYLVLKKEFKNINYFLMNQAKINEDFKFLIKKYNFDNFYIIDKEEDILNFEYDFVNFGSVIQYVPNYKSILNSIFKKTKKYILFSGTIFFEDTQRNDIIVKQINMWPNKMYSYFINYMTFIQIFKKNNFCIEFEKNNTTNNINFHNFDFYKFKNIFYKDLFFKKN
jgi:hypothetical protein